ncbi:MAG: type 4a pilus biogenesis protein PilO [Phycisphaeraceae bacterium]|nr:type 4a pilus biogenesis protein PilO [Phycisphaerales bacterium]MCB9860470.1 type 4a pilus biogenesis protein PilO [Phycisphaeraceae bacterium]
MFRGKSIAHESRWWLIHSIGLVVVISLTSAGYVFGVAPVINMENEREELGRLLHEAKEREQIIATNQARIASQLQTSVNEVDQAAVQLHTIEYQNQRFAEIAELAEASQVRINKLTPGETVIGEKHNTAPISLEATGTYASFSAFVRSIHAAFPDVGIRTFSLQSIQSASDGEASIVLDMSWHVAHTIQPEHTTR